MTQPRRKVWIDDWTMSYGIGDGAEGLRLRASVGTALLDLSLAPDKPPLAPEGSDAVGPRGFAMPRLAVTGSVVIDAEGAEVSGTAWLDRSWGDLPLPGGPIGYDRLIVHLSDGSDLSLLRTRRIGRAGAATLDAVLIDPDGAVTYLEDAALDLEVRRAEGNTPRGMAPDRGGGRYHGDGRALDGARCPRPGSAGSGRCRGTCERRRGRGPRCVGADGGRRGMTRWRRYPGRGALLLAVAALALAAGCREEDATEYRSPTGPVPTAEQRPGDPQAGYHALVNAPYVSCGIPLDAFRRLFPETDPASRLPGREGVNADLPYAFTAHERADGVTVVSSNCLTCHAAEIGGELVIGLGNEFADFTQDPRRLALQAGTYVRGAAETAAWEHWADRVEGIAPYIQTATVGVNPAPNLTWALMAHRDAETLEMV